MKSGPLAARERAKRAQNAEQVESQWSTLKSGPLAAWEKGERAQNAEKAESQWSTLESGPLVAWEKDEKGPKYRESRKPVVHFEEWTTS